MRRFSADGEEWMVDDRFLASRWTCIWGRGCLGIGDEVDPTHLLGCCSLGAELTDAADAANLSAHAACIPDELWQYAGHAASHGIFADDDQRATAVVDGACVFLNRGEMGDRAGCALHHAAVHHDEPPRDWKPNVCWELPLKIENTTDADGTAVTVLRRWQRRDFGSDAEMAWFCTDTDDAYVGDQRVVDALCDELQDLVGGPAADALAEMMLGVEPVDGLPPDLPTDD